MDYLKNFSRKLLSSFSRLATPTELILFVTESCNARCKHCFIHDLDNRQTISLQNIEKIAKSLKEPLNTLVITGGEPFLRDDIIQLYECFDKYNKPQTVIFCTNGLLEEKILEKINELIDKHPRLNVKVQISLDGLEETHDKIRNVPNIFKKANNTILRLKKLKENHKNLDIVILTVISNENYSEIKDLHSYVEEKLNVIQDYELIRGSKFFNISSSMQSNTDPMDSSLSCPSVSELEQLAPIIYSSYKTNTKRCYRFPKNAMAYAYKTAKYNFIIDVLKRKKPLKNCGAGKEWGVIYVSGDVGLCELLKPVGNLSDTDYNFNKLWNGEEAEKMRRAMKCYCTHGCFSDRAMFRDPKSYFRLAHRLFQFYL